MHSGRIVFSQVMNHLPQYEFRKCVARYRGNHRIKSFSCLDQFLSMAFGQLAYRESLRETVTCLRAVPAKLYHMGIRGNVSRSTLADANEKRDWRIYSDFANSLIAIARTLYAEESFGVELKQTAYVFDSTTIDLCLSLFPWARFRRSKGAIKLHTLMDLKGSIPCHISISDGKLVDNIALDHLVLEPGSFYIMDRGYIDFRRLHLFNASAAFFVVRAWKNLTYRRRESFPVDRSTGLRSDQTIVLTGPLSSQLYPDPLRRVSFYDNKRKTRYVFLTNNFSLRAQSISELYKCRWQVELFFRWIKQNLKIKAFYGTSQNAVKTQIWIAISIYVLVAIIRKRLNLTLSLAQILQILSITLLEQEPLQQLLTELSDKTHLPENYNQLFLFD